MLYKKAEVGQASLRFAGPLSFTHWRAAHVSVPVMHTEGDAVI